MAGGVGFVRSRPRWIRYIGDIGAWLRYDEAKVVLPGNLQGDGDGGAMEIVLDDDMVLEYHGFLLSLTCLIV